jgi:hypothetical protein
VKINCPDDLDSSTKECIEAIPLADSCILTCMAGSYPGDSPEASTVVMTVVASVALSGVNVVEFKTVEKEFKSALASTLSCSVDRINITNVTEVYHRRLLSDKMLPLLRHSHMGQRQLKRGKISLNIEFEVAVSSVDDLKSTTSTLQGKILFQYKKHIYNSLRRSSEWLNDFGRCFSCFGGHFG